MRIKIKALNSNRFHYMNQYHLRSVSKSNYMANNQTIADPSSQVITGLKEANLTKRNANFENL